MLAAWPLAGVATAQTPEIVVEAPTQRLAIERILGADNFDPANLTAREVADSLARIERGHAPDDFWDSYQRHVGAWQDYAEAEGDAGRSPAELRAARRAVNATLDEAERVALDYAARLPRPRRSWGPPY